MLQDLSSNQEISGTGNDSESPARRRRSLDACCRHGGCFFFFSNLKPFVHKSDQTKKIVFLVARENRERGFTLHYCNFFFFTGGARPWVAPLYLRPCPKGKENLASVLKRYKRRLSNKPVGAHEGSALRKVPTFAPAFRLIQASLTFDCNFLTQ
jgi:hypothetical protein